MTSIKSAHVLISVHSKRLFSMKSQAPMETMFSSCSRLLCGITTTMSRLYSSVTQKKFTVAIEGNIGSGKTSLLQHFVDSPNTQVYQEPVTKWRNIQGHNALAKMYEDPNRWALTFQTYVQLTMLQTHVKPQTVPVKLMERSIYSAKYCFVENLNQSGKMPDFEYVILSLWFDWLIENQNCGLDLIVYLRTTPEMCHERIKKRCRKEETTIPLDYLQSLHDLHEEWLMKQTNPKLCLPAPVLVLDANSDHNEMVKLYDAHRKQILCGYS